MVRVWIDHEGRLRLGRLRWEYGPGHREAEFEQVRRQYESTGAGPQEPTTLGVAGHDEVSIMLGDFGASWTLGAFDPDDYRWDREPVV